MKYGLQNNNTEFIVCSCINIKSSSINHKTHKISKNSKYLIAEEREIGKYTTHDEQNLPLLVHLCVFVLSLFLEQDLRINMNINSFILSKPYLNGNINGP